MSKDSSIEWTDHTYNPWWGCTKVSAGCTNCYADTLATRYGHNVWGPKADRRFFGVQHWAEPLKWNRDAEKAGVRARVFCASMADVFERHMVAEINARMEDARDQLWGLIAATPMLDWLLLTKRPENIGEMIPWADGAPENAWKADVSMWPNVWLGTSVENQEQAEKRIPELLKIPAHVRFLSCEPLLGPVDLRRYFGRWELLEETSPSGKSLFKCRSCGRVSQTPDKRCHPLSPGGGCAPWDGIGIHWVIGGGESGNGARPCSVEWVRSLRDQCQQADVAFFFKQWGGRIAKSGGRELDGRLWSEFPVVRRPAPEGGRGR